jgi:hypothetical protein
MARIDAIDSDCWAVGPDGKLVPLTYLILNKQGICCTCIMKHFPYCSDQITLCRTCGCGKEWHPLDGPCRVGPETEFTLYNCHCQKYIPKDNLQYLEYLVGKRVDKNKST